MTLIAFELSGEHPLIPVAEILGALEALSIDFSIYHRFERLLIIETQQENVHRMNMIARRLSMTWHIMEVLGISDDYLAEIGRMVENSEYVTPTSCTYEVRVKKIKPNSSISSEEIERTIGRILYAKGYRADLSNPNTRYRAVLSGRKCIFGIILGSVERGAFEHRNPAKKPFFYPGVVMPRLARALVNIARVKCDSIVLDPYCGTGGIMIEAGLIGAATLGCDIQKKIILGARMNLDFYLVNYSIMLQDAQKLAFRDECIDCIVSDPPYGRSAIIQAQSLDSLMKNSLFEMYRVLRPGGRTVVVSEHALEKWALDVGFHVVDVYIQRVHRSLTRRVTVLDK
jgi:tRNA (guanine10-N2)-dimethyltransferase